MARSKKKKVIRRMSLIVSKLGFERRFLGRVRVLFEPNGIMPNRYVMSFLAPVILFVIL